MTSRYYRLPSLNALATFEASARHRSLKRAAEDLNVTPSAVSRQIKALEDELGVRLFARGQTGLSLTPEGETLSATLGSAFSSTAATIERIRVDQREPRVTIACTHAFAKRWLMPRMPDFWSRYPDICVDHLISDDGREFRRAEVDLRERYGFGAWPDETSAKLFDDVIYPVAGTAFAARYAGHAAADIAALPLIHVDWVDPLWTGWDEFLRRVNVRAGTLKGRRFSNFDTAMEACCRGQGLALGWHRYILAERESGALVPFTELSVPSPGAYYATWNSSSAHREPVETLREWLLERATAEVDMPPAA